MSNQKEILLKKRNAELKIQLVAKARELKIESGLEKVRAVALKMKEPADMLKICRTIAIQLQSLGVKEIRNVQTAIFYKERGTYMNYEYYAKHDKTFITETTYNNNKTHKSFALKMQKGKGEFFITHIKGKKVKEWLTYQKTTNVFIDKYLNTASSLSYYWYSLGPVALGISTYQPLTKDEENLFRQFLKVFELAYRRYLDIEKAEAQTKEAKIEASLEKVRAQAMGMREPDDLLNVCETLFKELSFLGFDELRNAIINIHNNKDRSFINYDYANAVGKSAYRFTNNILPFVGKIIKTSQSTDNAFIESYISGKALAEFKRLRRKTGQKDDPRLNRTKSLYFYFYSIGIGSIGISTFDKITAEKKTLLKRFRNVFNLSYQRYIDIAKAEAQAKEAKIEASLERIRAAAMSLHKSEELITVCESMYKELKLLGFSNIRNAQIAIKNDAKESYSINAFSDYESVVMGEAPYKSSPIVEELYNELGKSGDAFYQKEFSGKKFKEWRRWRESLSPLKDKSEATATALCFYMYSIGTGHLGISTFNPITNEQVEILKRFKNVFVLSYQRYTDVAKAEAQAREAQIELALERVRARTMAMQKSDELSEAVYILFNQFKELGERPDQATIGIINEKEWVIEYWVTMYGNLKEGVFKFSIDEPNVTNRIYKAWKENKKSLVIDLSGKELHDFTTYRAGKGGAAYNPKEKRRIINVAFFSKGLLNVQSNELRSTESIKLLERFAAVFEQTYTRFLDLQKAEAQARESQIEAALERVRSRTLAMQKSDELAETAAVVFRQLINLGIAPNRLYIGVIKDDSGDIELWATDEDGSKVNTQFTGNIRKNITIKKMYDGWMQLKKSITIDMEGKELTDYFHYLSEDLKVPFKLGLSQKRRVQNIAYFAKGFIGMASPDTQPEETTFLLERFAAVFNLTYTRFNDLQIAEHHAEQAELDLIKLKEEKKRTENALNELQATQKQLIQSEKMASLGELTAGIAHEIQNPLNFVNNFSEVNKELLAEMNEEIEKGNYEEVKFIAKDVSDNEEKINHHGKRADAIVKGMLQHSRSSTGAKEPTDINALADEYLRLAYHGLRAKDKSFNALMVTDYDESIGNINIIPQDIGRVILNLITNAFYVVDERKNASTSSAGQLYEPTVSVSTKKVGDKVLISVKDNGNGIPQKVLDKIFQPFFTTKPTGQGTGLGLSLSYDIVKAHGGEIKVETKEGEGTEFIIQLPMV